jgi:hypothetical protein
VCRTREFNRRNDARLGHARDMCVGGGIDGANHQPRRSVLCMRATYQTAGGGGCRESGSTEVYAGIASQCVFELTGCRGASAQFILNIVTHGSPAASTAQIILRDSASVAHDLFEKNDGAAASPRYCRVLRVSKVGRRASRL